MNASPSLRDSADERLQGLFSESAELVQKTVADVIHEALGDPEFEEVVVATLTEAVELENDDSSASIWLCVILGEVRSVDAIAPLLAVLSSDDEMQQAAAIRAMRKIGPPALEHAVDLAAEPTVDGGLRVAAIQCLEGIALHDDVDLRDRIETELGALLVSPINGRMSLCAVEAAALALARLGVVEAKENIELLLERDQTAINMFLQEALEIIENNPQGVPDSAAVPWDQEFRWAFEDVLPGADLLDGDEDPGE